MTDVGYIVAGYGATAAVLGAYAWWVVARSRRLRRATRQEPRRDR